VLSPLLTPVFDAIDLARYLSQRGYQWAVSRPGGSSALGQPDPPRGEAQSPDLNFDVVVLDGSSPLHSL
jgi:hypothetical protein